MVDVVIRLRHYGGMLLTEAADEIERLRKMNTDDEKLAKAIAGVIAETARDNPVARDLCLAALAKPPEKRTVLQRVLADACVNMEKVIGRGDVEKQAAKTDIAK